MPALSAVRAIRATESRSQNRPPGRRDDLAGPPSENLAGPLEPAPVNKLGQRGRRRFRPSTRQAGQAREAGV
jgi:hypothetical protein